MYRNFKNEFGVGPTLYRSPEEIRYDISNAREALQGISERLNPRILLNDIVNDERCGRPKELLAALEDALARAQDTYVEIKSLREELSELEDELRETLCAMGY